MPVGYRLGCLGVSGDVNYRKLLMFMSRDVILLWMLRGGLATSTQSHTHNDSYECTRKQIQVPGTGSAVCSVKVYLRSDMGMQVATLCICSCRQPCLIVIECNYWANSRRKCIMS